MTIKFFWCSLAAAEIVDDLEGRKGILDDVDEDIKDEIENCITKTIQKYYEKNLEIDKG
jgi:hypothetical protein